MPVGNLTFVFPTKPEWSQVVHVFLVEEWNGEPTESDEMEPRWFTEDEIPYSRMWQDGAYWLPPILKGQGSDKDIAKMIRSGIPEDHHIPGQGDHVTGFPGRKKNQIGNIIPGCTGK